MPKKLISLVVCCLLAVVTVIPSLAFGEELDARSLILIEATTGKVLYERNADEALPPASVTKVMTMLLVMEAVDSGRLSLSDNVQVSMNAASMGGSQIYLEPGEIMTAEDMLKAVVISSANDAAVALAEHIAGSEEAFVELMNKRAAELGMTNTKFENTNGLDDTTDNHLTSARDIALMSRELIVNHPKILEYSSIWTDSVRNGEFGLTNTNRLIRFYSGANGLKTGSTSKAKFCISAAAKRNELQLIAVVMAAPTRDDRNETAKKLLDYGFANYSFYRDTTKDLEPLKVLCGIKDSCPIICGDYSAVIAKGSEEKIEKTVLCEDVLTAPIEAGTQVGVVEYTQNGEKLGEVPILAAESIDKVGYLDLLGRIIKKFLLI